MNLFLLAILLIHPLALYLLKDYVKISVSLQMNTEHGNLRTSTEVQVVTKCLLNIQAQISFLNDLYVVVLKSGRLC